jgi:protein-disulfide isomerase
LIKKLALFVIALAASLGAQQSTANLPNQDTVKQFVEHMVGYDPAIKFQVTSIKPAEAPGFADVSVVLNNGQGEQVLNFYVSPDGKWALIGQMMDFGADPFARYRAMLQKADGPIRGAKDAKVTIVEFADLECPACKAALPNIEKMQSENPNVRVIFQNFPLEKLHPWALRAALYVDCLKSQNDVAWKFIDTVYQHQEEIKPETADALLKQYAGEAGAGANVATCIADPKTKADVMASEGLGESVAVSATPTLFVNGRKIQSFNSLPYETFKQLVTYAENNP